MVRRARIRLGTWIDPLARFGFAVRGVVYALVGVLAAGAALGLRRRATDPHGVIGALGREPFGTVLLLVVGLGLAAYALWRFAQACSTSMARAKASRHSSRVRRSWPAVSSMPAWPSPRSASASGCAKAGRTPSARWPAE